ncbi:hypothetical protein TNCV_657871 [Trichonephila clavipes]|uniref:Uncharacterized protein n=1 Tax=Trichonephila clavipes TaxID=2585209 RepID=A0A8X6VLC9_TRICX|nr:hypothetical protein TNCV_657871 [Trichonephila clavipes]
MQSKLVSSCCFLSSNCLTKSDKIHSIVDPQKIDNKEGRIVQVFSGKTQTVQDMFGRGLLNLALGAELKSLPALKEGETFRVSTSQSGNGRFRCSVAVEIQKRARFPGRIPVVGGREESSTP